MRLIIQSGILAAKLDRAIDDFVAEARGEHAAIVGRKLKTISALQEIAVRVGQRAAVVVVADGERNFIAAI